MNTPKSECRIEVRFRDIDAMGHVNNAVYLSYFEQARMKYFEDVVGKWDWHSSGVLLARNEVDYLRPVMLNDSVLVETFCLELGKKSLKFAYDVYVEEENERTKVASGKSVLVCFDYKSGQTIEVPELWREKLI